MKTMRNMWILEYFSYSADKDSLYETSGPITPFGAPETGSESNIVVNIDEKTSFEISFVFPKYLKEFFILIRFS